jgi:phosphosulfolactate synthase (CoM biosynthesis protein A)
MGSSATLADAGSSMTRKFCIPEKIALTNLFVKAGKEKFLRERFRAPGTYARQGKFYWGTVTLILEIEAEAAIKLAGDSLQM